jgi:hypothetical protein
VIGGFGGKQPERNFLLHRGNCRIVNPENILPLIL